MIVSVKSKWVLARDNGRPVLLEDRYLLIEGGRIVALTSSRPTSADVWIEPVQGLVIPGLINLHSHCINAPLFRGHIDDIVANERAEDAIYSFLMPMGQLAMDMLTPHELASVVEIGLVEELRTGTTTVLDMWRPEEEVFFEVAQRVGIRAYGAPYIRSTPIAGIDDGGMPIYGPEDSDRSLQDAIGIFERHDQGPNGRLRVVLGPHGLDSCSPGLLKSIADLRTELGTIATIHAAQSRSESDVVQRRDGVSPITLLTEVGLADERTVAAHCLYASDAELSALATAGVTVAHCPATYARIGVGISIDRFWNHGVRVGIGTDAYRMDMLAEVRLAGFFAKLNSRKASGATAWRLVEAATRVAADALGRPDLGRIEPGATADLVVLELMAPHLQPVVDPVKTLVWYATKSDIAAVLVDGEVRYDAQVHTAQQDAELMSSVASGIAKVAHEASRRGFLPPTNAVVAGEPQERPS